MSFATASGGVAAPKPPAAPAAPAGQTYSTGVYQGGSTPTPNTQFDPGSLPSYINLPSAGWNGFVSGMSEGTVPPAPDGSIFGRPNGPYGGPALAEVNRPYDPTAAAKAAGVFPAPSVGGGSSSAPQYQLPDFHQLLQDALDKLGYGQIDNGLHQQQQQLLIRFGDPNLAALAGFGADPQSADFAKQNYLSGNADLARLDKQNQLSKQAIINQLAAHGLLFSGDTGYKLGQQDTAYGQSRYDLTNRYLDALNSLMQNALQQKNAIRSNAITSILNAFAPYAANPQQLAGIFG